MLAHVSRVPSAPSGDPWRKQAPDFSVSLASSRASTATTNILHSDYVYEVGSPEGCGCAFIDEHWDEDDDAEENRLIRKSRKKLLRYLSEAVENTGDVRVQLAWSGDERKRPNLVMAGVDQVAGMDFRDTSDRPLLIQLVTGRPD